MVKTGSDGSQECDQCVFLTKSFGHSPGHSVFNSMVGSYAPQKEFSAKSYVRVVSGAVYRMRHAAGSDLQAHELREAILISLVIPSSSERNTS